MKDLKEIAAIKKNSVIGNLLSYVKQKETSLETLSTSWNDSDEQYFQILLQFAVKSANHEKYLLKLNKAISNYLTFKSRYRRKKLESVRKLEILKVLDIKRALLYSVSFSMLKTNQLNEMSYIEAFQNHSMITPDIKISEKKDKKEKKEDKGKNG